MVDRVSTALRREVRIRRAERKVQRAVESAMADLANMAVLALDQSGMDPAVLDERWPQWIEIVHSIDPVLEKVFRDAYSDSLTAAVVNPADEAAARYMASVSNRMVGIADNVFRLIIDSLGEGRQAGEGVPDLAARVERLLAQEGAATWARRGVTVARTEVIAASNAGSHAAAVDTADALGHAHGEVAKEWLATMDERTRETHAEADGQMVVGADTLFQVGGDLLQYPGDPSGSPEEVINCRCTVLYHYPGDAEYPTNLTAGGDMTETIEPEAEAEFTSGQPWYGILAPEGVVSGDRRKFAPESLRWRDLPLPLEWQEQTAPYHDGAYVVGRIDTIERTADGLLSATGVWHDSEEAQKAYSLVQNKMLRGLSVELDEATATYEDDDGNPVNADDWFWESMLGEDDAGPMPIEVVTDGRICAVTLLPVPAFQEAFVANGTPADLLAYTLDMTKVYVSEEPWGNFTAADYTPEQWKNATLIHLDPAEGQDPLSKDLHKLPVYEPGGALNRGGVHAAASALAGGRGGVDAPADKIAQAATTLVGLYRNQLDEEPPDSLVSLAGSGVSASLVAAAWPVARAEHFSDPELFGPTAVTLDKDGRVYGHLATWGTCHIGFPGTCQTPPRSMSQYAHFLTGLVETDAGPIPVGSITMGTGHADPALPPYAAVEHYDNTGTVIADVTMGEDVHGIWFSGRVRPGADPGKVAEFVASGAVSGDWRTIGGSLELVAALVVNVAGFPIPRLQVAASGGRQTALVASAVVGPTRFAIRTHGVGEPTALVAAVMATLDRRERVKRITRRVKGGRSARLAAAVRLVDGE